MLKNSHTPIAVALSTIAVLAVAPGIASAASVEKLDSGNIIYNAGDGANDLQITDIGSDIAFTDAALVVAGPNCQQLGPKSASCPETNLATILAYVEGGVNEVHANTAFPTHIYADGPGINTFFGGAGRDRLHGGDGHDLLHGGFGNDFIDGGAGGDEMIGLSGDDEIHGNTGPDLLLGGSDDDTLEGGSGGDSLDGGRGADEIEGGLDEDTVDYSGRIEAVHVSLGTGGLVANDGELGEGDDVGVSVESVVGGSGDDELLADASGESIRFDGGAGDDLLQGGAGSDVLDGGIGRGDRVTYAGSTAPVRADLDGAASDDGAAGEGDTILEVESLIGSAFSDLLKGSAVANRIEGGAGRDRITGLNGRDLLAGGSGRDTVRSRDRRKDRVRCGSGNDRVRADRKDRLRRCERS